MTREEALKIVRENYPHFGTTEPWLDLEKALARLIPELAESEDERIRKVIVKYFEELHVQSWINLEIPDILAWLEKQKEQKLTATINGEPIPTENHSVDIPLAEWSEEDEDMINGCIHAIEYELIDNGQDEQVATDPRIAFLKSIRLQPKQEWSEDEIIYWNTIKDYFFGIPLDDKLKSALDWFKSLKPQPKQEWSDTNELVFQDICKHLKEEGCGGWVLFLNALRNGEFQPKQEWSEKDEACIRNLESIIYYDKKLPNDTRVILGEFLSNLRPQPKQELSKEDETYLQDALWCVKQAYKLCKTENDTGTCWSAEKWLKSLKLRMQ